MISTPVPVRETVCGLPVALSVIVTDPLCVPVASGVNLTLIVQCDPAESEVPQPVVSEKSPLGMMLVMLRDVVPVLERVTDFDELVVLTC